MRWRPVDFDPQRDRLFTVGSLVNRGLSSHEAGDWLERPSRIICVARGNHDAQTLNRLLYRRRAAGEATGNWLDRVPVKQTMRWTAALRRMPFAITIETRHEPVGVLHAVPARDTWKHTIRGSFRWRGSGMCCSQAAIRRLSSSSTPRRDRHDPSSQVRSPSAGRQSRRGTEALRQRDVHHVVDWPVVGYGEPDHAPQMVSLACHRTGMSDLVASRSPAARRSTWPSRTFRRTALATSETSRRGTWSSSSASTSSRASAEPSSTTLHLTAPLASTTRATVGQCP